MLLVLLFEVKCMKTVYSRMVNKLKTVNLIKSVSLRENKEKVIRLYRNTNKKVVPYTSIQNGFNGSCAH